MQEVGEQILILLILELQQSKYLPAQYDGSQGKLFFISKPLPF